MQLVKFFIFIFFMLFIISSFHLFFGLPSSRVNILFKLYTFLPFSLPAFDVNGQTSLIFVFFKSLSFVRFIIFLCLINSYNSSFVLIFHVPSLYFVRPKILLNTFLSNTINLFFVVSFKTHVSQAYVTIGLIILQYNFSFDFLETSLLLKKNWLA